MSQIVPQRKRVGWYTKTLIWEMDEVLVLILARVLILVVIDSAVYAWLHSSL